MTDYDVGDPVSVSASASGTRPKYLAWDSGALAGDAELPSGHRRLVYLDGGGRQEEDLAVYPIYPIVGNDYTTKDWLAFIFAPDGSYIYADGLRGIPTVGTPVVRMTDSAPSKAVLKIPPSRGAGNVLASDFAGWTGGYEGPVERGMELAVHFRDSDTGAMTLAFRGMIYEVASGEAVEITAYDRMMDLYQFSDQYQSHANYEDRDDSASRTASGSDYIYQMHRQVGTITSAWPVDYVDIDPTSQMGDSGSMTTPKSFPRVMAIPLDKDGGVHPDNGWKIHEVRFNMYASLYGQCGSTGSGTIRLDAHARVHFYKRTGGIMNEMGVSTTQDWSVTLAFIEGGFKTDKSEPTLTWGTDWLVDGDWSQYYIGIEVWHTITYNGSLLNAQTVNVYAKYNASRIVTEAAFLTSPDGISWTVVDTGEHPEPAIRFNNLGSSIATNLFTVSGSTVRIAQASIPAGPSATYLSTVEAGVGVRLAYFISGATSIKTIVEDLLTAAGLVPDMPSESMGATTYYTSSTFDYLTCLQELLREGNYGLGADIYEAGRIRVRPRHTIDETPLGTVSTEPGDGNAHIIVSHNLTSRWMAEKATVAYMAEDVTSSGLPIALETDDALMDGSLVKALQSPLRSASADSTLGTHDLMAIAAGGKMVQLHTNVFEGSMALTGYRLVIWDHYCGGGRPIGIEVPEYGASGTAIPTEIILHDGVTEVSLDNIRTADRSEVARSMGLTADAISNNMTSLPTTSYIFARIDTEAAEAGLAVGTVTAVTLYEEDGTLIDSQTSSAYIKQVKDAAGYAHIVAIFPQKSPGYAVSDPIGIVSATWGGNEYKAPLDNPKYAFDGQNVHVDIRVKSA